MQFFFAFLGRALLSLVFIVAAFHKIFHWQETEQYLHMVLLDERSWGSLFFQGGIDWVLSHLFLVLAVGVCAELVGGLLLFFGFGVRLGSLLLLLVCASATVVFHHFWDMQEPQKELEMVHFMKNLSIMGGLLFVLARGKGDCSSKNGDSEE